MWASSHEPSLLAGKHSDASETIIREFVHAMAASIAKKVRARPGQNLVKGFPPYRGTDREIHFTTEQLQDAALEGE